MTLLTIGIFLNKLANKSRRIFPILLSRFYYPIVFAKFGAKSVLEHPTFISLPQYISIGRNTFIRRGVRLETIESTNAFKPKLNIGDNCLIEQNVQIICRRFISIGQNVSIAGHCALVDVTHPYSDDGDENIGHRIANSADELVVEDGCFIGFGAVVLPGVHLGKGCVVGANSVVTRSFGPRSVIAGAPARLIKTY